MNRHDRSILVEEVLTVGDTIMSLPHFPSEGPDDEDAPNLNDVVDRILNGGDNPLSGN